MRRLLPLVPLLAAATACEPELDDRTSIIDDVTILGFASEPAEVKPNEAVTYKVLVGDPKGSVRDVVWDYCNDRKPLAELGPASRRCFEVGTADFLQRLGNGPEIQATMPQLACRNFGPEVPPPLPDEPFGRPVDPDSTGGFYQPVRILVLGSRQVLALGRSRVSCGIASVTAEIATEYARRYVANENPVLESVQAGGAALVEGEAGNPVRRGQTVQLLASWPACDAAPCDGAEPYVAYDPARKVLAGRRETIRVAWFATAGAFDEDRTGRDGKDTATFTENGWTAPDTAGKVTLWVVVRDDRAGQSWKSFVLDVE